MQVELTKQEAQLISEVLRTLFIKRGGCTTISNEKIAIVLDVLPKITNECRDSFTLEHNMAVEREDKEREELEKLKHPFKLFIKSILSFFKSKK